MAMVCFAVTLGLVTSAAAKPIKIKTALSWGAIYGPFSPGPDGNTYGGGLFTLQAIDPSNRFKLDGKCLAGRRVDWHEEGGAAPFFSGLLKPVASGNGKLAPGVATTTFKSGDQPGAVATGDRVYASLPTVRGSVKVKGKRRSLICTPATSPTTTAP
jgi:hypothetical protein